MRSIKTTNNTISMQIKFVHKVYFAFQSLLDFRSVDKEKKGNYTNFQ